MQGKQGSTRAPQGLHKGDATSIPELGRRERAGVRAPCVHAFVERFPLEVLQRVASVGVLPWVRHPPCANALHFEARDCDQGREQ